MQAQQCRALIEPAARRKCGPHVELPEAAFEIGAPHANLTGSDAAILVLDPHFSSCADPYAQHRNRTHCQFVIEEFQWLCFVLQRKHVQER